MCSLSKYISTTNQSLKGSPHCPLTSWVNYTWKTGKQPDIFWNDSIISIDFTACEWQHIFIIAYPKNIRLEEKWFGTIVIHTRAEGEAVYDAVFYFYLYCMGDCCVFAGSI